MYTVMPYAIKKMEHSVKCNIYYERQQISTISEA